MDPLLLQTALVYPHGVNFSSNLWVSLLFHDIKNHKGSETLKESIPYFPQLCSSKCLPARCIQTRWWVGTHFGTRQVRYLSMISYQVQQILPRMIYLNDFDGSLGHSESINKECIRDKLLPRPSQQPLHPLQILCDELPQDGFADGIVGQRHGRAGSGAHGD